MRFGNPCDRWMRMDKMSSSENVRQRSPMSIRATTPGGKGGEGAAAAGPPSFLSSNHGESISVSDVSQYLIASFFPWPALNQKRQTTNDIPFSCFWYFNHRITCTLIVQRS